jgi:GT2 family glycosyltransferase
MNGIGETRKPLAAVVILNWNGAADTLECLRSLATARAHAVILVVDNGSDDDSVAKIRDSQLADEVIENHENLGFAAGNNVGITRALALTVPVVIVLNNDTVVPDGTILGLINYLLAAPDSDVAVSATIRYFDAPKQIWFEGGVVDRGWPRHLQPDEVAHLQSGATRPTQLLSGCCIAARDETWKKVGLFDPNYFLIFEDSDWSVRALQRNVRLEVALSLDVLHKVSASFGEHNELLASYYFARNGLYYVSRYATPHLAAFLMRWLIRPTASRLAKRRRTSGLGFRWAGAAAFLLRQRGKAPAWVERWAVRAELSRQRRGARGATTSNERGGTPGGG